MKRVLTFLAILLLPLSLWAMTPINDTQLSDVTGQAGVSINFDFTLSLQFGQLGWGDSDGYAGFAPVGSGGWVGIDSLQMSTLHIWPRTDFTMDNTTFAGGPAYQPDEGGWNQLQYLTIDVATVPSFWLGGPFGTNVTGVTAVIIGIPTLSLTMASMDGNVVLGPRKAAQSVGGQIDGTFVNEKNIQGPGFNQLLGTFYIGGMNMATAGGGTVAIFAHGTGSIVGAVSTNTLYGSGVTIALTDVRVAYLLFDVMSWGDIDGLYATGFATAAAPAGNATFGLMGPGYVGLTNVAIKNLMLNGAIAIDVFTVRAPGAAGPLDPISSINDTVKTPAGLAGEYRCLVGAFNDIYFNTPPGSIATPTIVSIGFKNGFQISLDAFGGQVTLGPEKTLTTTPQVMGDIYVGGMTMTILDNPVAGNGSFVHIMAH
jgi:Family of unknown function (DUF6160)